MVNKNNDIIRRLKQEIKKELKKCVQESGINHMMVGYGSKKSKKNNFYYLWQPHNFRLYFDFSKENFNPKKPSNHTLNHTLKIVPNFNKGYNYSSLNFDSEHRYQNFMGCSIRVKKKQIEVINMSYEKQWVELQANSIAEIDDKIEKRVNKLVEDSKVALKAFISLYGGKSEFNILNHRCEHGIHGDDFIDKIPDDMIIHDTYFKKVYKKKAEFKDTTSIKNYISNRAIEEIAPTIANELKNINMKLDIANPLVSLKNRVNCIQDIIDNQDLVRLLTDEEKTNFENWLFTIQNE